jgi:hypothetical protein
LVVVIFQHFYAVPARNHPFCHDMKVPASGAPAPFWWWGVGGHLRFLRDFDFRPALVFARNFFLANFDARMIWRV